MPKKQFEANVQDFVYSMDETIGRKVGRFIILVTCIMVLALVYTASQFRGLKNSEGMELSQLGRNLVEKQHYTTQSISPLSTWYMMEKSPIAEPMVGNQPDLTHAPAYPSLLAGAFAIPKLLNMEMFALPETSELQNSYPAERWVVIPLNNFFVIMTGLLLYIFGKKLFSKKLALLGIFVYFLSNLVWADSISGLGIPLASFFVVGTALFALIASKRSNESQGWMRWIGHLLLASAFCAGAFLTRYALWVLMPGIFLFLILACRRDRGGWWLPSLFLTVFLLLIAPWLARNLQVAGNPFGMAPWMALQNTKLFADNALSRTLAPEFTIGQIIKTLRVKWLLNMGEFYKSSLVSTGGGLLSALFFLFFFRRVADRRVASLRWGVLVSLLLFFVGAPLFGENCLRFYNVFWAFILLFGMAHFLQIVNELEMPFPLLNQFLISLIVALSALPLVFELAPPKAKSAYPPYRIPYIQYVSKLFGPHELICSDMPWAVAWYGNRTSLMLPDKISTFYEFNDYIRHVNGLYFTPLTMDKRFSSELLKGENDWVPLINGKTPQAFPLKAGIPLVEHEQFLWADYTRWNTEEE